MNIIVTGANGFVGKNLMSFLGNEFIVDELSVRYIPDQVLDIDSDVVIHLSGKAHDLKSVAEPSDYYEANFELTKQLYDAFLNSRARKFIFISSVKASADNIRGISLETDSPNPKTHYGKSKLMAEQYIQSLPLPENKSYYILRPCMIHGPGNKGNLNLLYNVVKKGIPYPLGAFRNLRSFLSITNLNFIIHKIILDSFISSGVYNVSDDDALSTTRVIEIISRVNGCKAKIWNINPSIITALARIGDILHLPLNSERLEKLTESYVVSNEKIKKALNIKRLPISSTLGLTKTIESF